MGSAVCRRRPTAFRCNGASSRPECRAPNLRRSRQLTSTPAFSATPAARASSNRSSRTIASPSTPAVEPTWPIVRFTRRYLRAWLGSRAIEMDFYDTLSCRIAVMNAGDNLLTDIAALLEVDAVH